MESQISLSNQTGKWLVSNNAEEGLKILGLILASCLFDDFIITLPILMRLLLRNKSSKVKFQSIEIPKMYVYTAHQVYNYQQVHNSQEY